MMISAQCSIALAILIGMALVAAAIFISGGINAPNVQPLAAGEIDPRRSDNRLLVGDPHARITIVEFSDYECPYCSRLHPTLTQLVNDADGNVAWEFRHLPLSIHQNAFHAAYAAECVARLSGTDAFWSFTDEVFTTDMHLSPAYLEATALQYGMDEDELTACINSDETKAIVAADIEAARSLGGSGTPFSVVVYPDGTTQSVSGALPYEAWQPLLAM